MRYAVRLHNRYKSGIVHLPPDNSVGVYEVSPKRKDCGNFRQHWKDCLHLPGFETGLDDRDTKSVCFSRARRQCMEFNDVLRRDV